MKQRYADWELAFDISKLMLKCDALDISGRCGAIAAAGHEPRFLIGVRPDMVAAIARDLIANGDLAKKRLFGTSQNMRRALQGNPAELKRRLADSARGMRSKIIYSAMLMEPDGGQGYVVFRLPRSNKCIVYMLCWDDPR